MKLSEKRPDRMKLPLAHSLRTEVMRSKMALLATLSGWVQVGLGQILG
jgi:hypothetical protein